jgi:RNA polymerase sigma factor (sigma-70 family)
VAEPPDTRASLLLRIRDAGNEEAWRQFVDLYAPLIYGLARRRGLQDADAADLMQEVFRSVATAIRGLDYDPRHGSFRGWLYTVARNRLSDLVSSRKRPGQGAGGSGVQVMLEEQPGREDDSGYWDREYERQVFAWAAEQVRGEFKDSTWRAFWLTAVEGQSGEEAAATLGLSMGAVYAAKSRVLTRLREEVRLLAGE